jgi:FtsZ-interacting cell division protein YlmF
MPLGKSEHPAKGQPSARNPQQQSEAPPRDATGAEGRKPWKKKTPAEIVMEQGTKLKEEIARLEAEIVTKKQELQKFEEVRRIFGG